MPRSGDVVARNGARDMVATGMAALGAAGVNYGKEVAMDIAGRAGRWVNKKGNEYIRRRLTNQPTARQFAVSRLERIAKANAQKREYQINNRDEISRRVESQINAANPQRTMRVMALKRKLDRIQGPANQHGPFLPNKRLRQLRLNLANGPSRVITKTNKTGDRGSMSRFSSKRSFGRSKVSGRGYKKNSKRKRGKAKFKKGKGRKKGTKAVLGPLVKTAFWYPSNSLAGIAAAEANPWFSITDTYVANSVLNITKDREDYIGYHLMGNKWMLRVFQQGEKASELDNTVTLDKGLFDPNNQGGSTGIVGVTTRNYVKITDKVLVKSAVATLYLSNTLKTPLHVWIYTSKPKKSTDSPLHLDISNAYINQNVYDGLGYQAAPSTSTIFGNPATALKDIKRLNNWKDCKLKHNFIITPGTEMELKFRYKDLVFDGLKNGLDGIGADNFSPNLARAIFIGARGMLGASTDAVQIAGFSAGQLSTKIKIEIIAQRENIFGTSSKMQYNTTMNPFTQQIGGGVYNVIEPALNQYG